MNEQARLPLAMPSLRDRKALWASSCRIPWMGFRFVSLKLELEDLPDSASLTCALEDCDLTSFGCQMCCTHHATNPSTNHCDLWHNAEIESGIRSRVCRISEQ